MGKDCFSDIIGHGGGKLTLFGRVLADMPEHPARQNLRSALIPVPAGLNLAHYVVNSSFITADPDDPHRNKQFFVLRSAHDPKSTASGSRPIAAATTLIQANMCAGTPSS